MNCGTKLGLVGKKKRTALNGSGAAVSAVTSRESTNENGQGGSDEDSESGEHFCI